MGVPPGNSVVAGPVGLAVMPAQKTSRVVMSMKTDPRLVEAAKTVTNPVESGTAP